jgi:putative transposase
MLKAFKYRIYPKESQITNLENQCSMCRHLYNWSLQERIKSYEEEGKSVTYYDQANKLPALKVEKPWYKGVSAQALQDVLRRLDKAFKAFFQRIKDGDIPGFPKFQKKGQWNSITFPQDIKLPSEGTIAVPKVGDVKIQYHREIPNNAKIKTLTIIKEGTKWFASFSVEYPLELELKPVQSVVGIDLGLIDFYYGSDGSQVSVPKFFRKREKQLKKLQKKLSKTQKRTPKYFDLLRAVQKVHFKIRCQRQDFLHKTANYLLDKFDAVVVENLNIKNMMKRPKAKQDENGIFIPNGASKKSGLNKSISDVGWSRFILFLKYKAEEKGKKIIEVNPKYTSQACSQCGTIVKKSLSTRTHRCCECDFVANRDHNAALNILGLGLQSLGANP